jgi:hypothetical protein
MLDESRRNRIVPNVAGNGVDCLFISYDVIVIAALPEVSVAVACTLLEVLSKAHERRHFAALNENMEMVRHETVSEYFKLVLCGAGQ